MRIIQRDINAEYGLCVFRLVYLNAFREIYSSCPRILRIESCFAGSELALRRTRSLVVWRRLAITIANGRGRRRQPSFHYVRHNALSVVANKHPTGGCECKGRTGFHEQLRELGPSGCEYNYVFN